MLGSDKMGKKTPAQGKGVAKKESTGTKKRQKSMFDFFGKSKPAATPVQRAARSDAEILKVVQGAGASASGTKSAQKTSDMGETSPKAQVEGGSSTGQNNSSTGKAVVIDIDRDEKQDTVPAPVTVAATGSAKTTVAATPCVAKMPSVNAAHSHPEPATDTSTQSVPRMSAEEVSKPMDLSMDASALDTSVNLSEAPKRVRKRISYVVNDSESDEEHGDLPNKKRSLKKKRVVESDCDSEGYIPDPSELIVEADEMDTRDHSDMEESLSEPETDTSMIETTATKTKKRALPTPSLSIKKTAPNLDNFSRTTPTPATPATPYGSLSAKRKSPTSSSSSARRSSGQFATPSSRGTTPSSQGKGGEGSAKNAQRYGFLIDQRDGNKRRAGDVGFDKNTLYVPEKFMREFSNFERQYWEIKKNNWDTIVFFKKGKFYELYEKDADIGAAEFDLKMTDRVNMKMVGVPEKTFVTWAAKFIGLGYKVARVDERESNLEKNMREKKEKGKKKGSIIQRTLSFILTAGTLTGDMVVGDEATYIMAVKEEFSLEGAHYGIVFCDAATGQFSLVEFADDPGRTLFETLMVQIKPKEIILERGCYSDSTKQIIRNCLNTPILNVIAPTSEFYDAEQTISHLKHTGYFTKNKNADADDSSGNWPEILAQWTDKELVMSALGGLTFYLGTLKLDMELLSHGHFTAYDPMRQGKSLLMDGQTLKNLEVLENNMGTGQDGTLFSLVNHCKTPFGTRHLKTWLCHPLRQKSGIENRYDAIEDIERIDDIRYFNLDCMPDLERQLARVHAGNLPLVQFITLIQTMRRLYTDVVALQSPANGEESAISQCRSPLLKKLLTIGEGFPDLEDALKFFEQSFDHEEALLANNIVPKEGVDEDYDAAKAAVEEIEGELEEHLKEVQKKLGCKKVIYKDIGNEKYQLEIPVTVKVPSSYMLKSSTKAAKRYWTGFIEARHLPLAEARAVFNRVVKETHVRTLNRFDTCSDLWKKAVACISEFDCLLSLHMCSMSLGEPRCRPILMESDDSTPPVLDLKSMRHPTIAHRLSEGYVPNDTLLGLNEESKGAPIVLLTGPNMGGKSTLLRQTCMAIVMAQLGCFIPAESCRMTLTDRIFTRIGANDNILAGQSTFMVELKETSNILQHATKNSLVILDELGRGTSTFDGYAIAFAVLKHLINDVGCRAMFATHYHMLCEEFKRERSVANMHMSCLVDEDKRDVTFLYQLALGVCSKSYGMNVANMAGVPRQVIERAEEKAKLIEINGGYSRMAHTYSTSNPEFLTLFKALKDNDSQQLMNLLEGL